MFGCRGICVSVASTAFVALSLSSSRRVVIVTHAFVMNDGRFTRRIMNVGSLSRSTSCASSSDSPGDVIPSPFSQLYDETLVSVQQCINAYNEEQRQRQSQQRTKSKQSSKIVHIDGSWYHRPDPTTGLHRNPSQEYIIGPRLPNARHLDIDAIATTYDLFPDQNPKGLPHMMPPPNLFALAMDAYNIRNEDHIVIYARRGALFTPRVWFLFVCMGHDPKKVHLMQGSLEDYMEEGGLVETNSLLVEEDDELQKEEDHCDTMGESYIDYFDQGILDVNRLYQKYYANTTPLYSSKVSRAMHICGKEEVLDAVNEYLESGNAESKIAKDGSFSKTTIIDTRGSGYTQKGYMPSAIHLPYSQIATPTNSLAIQPKAELKKLFEERGIDYLDPELKIILSCGSGVSVCHGYLALKELGRNITEENTRIYDGSWMEWGNETDTPKILLNQ